MESWVLFTLLAAVMQSIRTAGQKAMVRHTSPMATTLVRYLFGLPFALLYFLWVASDNPVVMVSTALGGLAFCIYAGLASIAQILATVCLVKVLSLRNFAVGSSFAKTEAIQAALLGLVFFHEWLTWTGWLAVILGVIGVITLSMPAKAQRLDGESAFYGILSGAFFALTAIWLRQASLSLQASFIENAAITLLCMMIFQTFICLSYMAIKEFDQLFTLRRYVPLAFFVGATSALGSVGWYTAMTYENAALVKSLGQIELVFTLMITGLFFKERLSLKEYVGMVTIVVSALILLLFT